MYDYIKEKAVNNVTSNESIKKKSCSKINLILVKDSFFLNISFYVGAYTKKKA